MLLTVRGMSMYPVLQPGQVIVCEPVAFEKIGLGQIIVFDAGDGKVCHRVIARSVEHLKLKGDNNNFSDNIKVVKKHVIGVIKGL